MVHQPSGAQQEEKRATTVYERLGILGFKDVCVFSPVAAARAEFGWRTVVPNFKNFISNFNLYPPKV